MDASDLILPSSSSPSDHNALIIPYNDPYDHPHDHQPMINPNSTHDHDHLQISPNLDNIDWSTLLSSPSPLGAADVAPFELGSMSMTSSSSSAVNNNNHHHHQHQMGGDGSTAEINGVCGSNYKGDNRGGLGLNSSNYGCKYTNCNYGSSISNNNGSGGKKKGVIPRVAFYTKSDEDVLDDGYKWRKYGQKSVKNSAHPRSYYRCTYHTCNVKKQIQRHSRDKSIVITTYEGIHNHPSEKLMETLSPLLKQLQFLSRF